MRNFLLALAATIATTAAIAQSQPRWIMQPSISPDGKWIAFSYKGNLFKVASTGGPATPLTINSSYNGYPVWSHDGKKIAFASDRYGDFDVFIMSATGGEPTRLTYNSARDIPYDFTPDDQHVVFGTDRHDIYTSARFPGDAYWAKLFEVPTTGGASTMLNSAGTEFVHYNDKGDKLIFQDRKGYEDPWRKHHTSGVTRDIWILDLAKDQYTKVSDYKGEDREPVWGKGDVFYYLSERNGNQNLYRSSLANSAEVQQLTHFEKNPVRQLSRSSTDGLLVFTYDGDLYTCTDGSEPKKLPITLDADFAGDETTIVPIRGEVSEMTVSQDGKQVAFVYRGDIFVASADGTTSRRITNTPYQERMVEFSPDGRSLLYSVEHDASWDIEQVSIASKSEPYFFAATLLTTTPIIATDKDEFQGVYSPNGKKIAYLEERNILKTYDLATKTTTTLIPEGINYSYADGDQYFTWSPDSKYILAESSEGGGWNSHDIVLLKDEAGAKRVNLTLSGFNDDHAQWGMDGKMMYWVSNKNGLKNLSRGGQNDVYAMFFDQKAWDRFELNKEDFDLKVEMGKKDTTKKPAEKIELNLRNLEDRSQRLTSNSALLADAVLSKDGEKLFYLARYEKGFDLWVTTLRTHETKQLAKLDANGGGLELTKDGKSLFVLAGGSIYKVATEDGKISPVKINAEMQLNAAAERAYIFDHIYKQVKKKLFDPKLNGCSWDYYHTNYAAFLPQINNYYDFQVLLSEFLGELNVSHTGGRYRPDFPNGDETATLGLFYDLTRKSDGLLVKEVIAGGPFDIDGSHMTAGMIIDRIDGQPITTKIDYAALLNHKAGQLTLISFHDPHTSAAYEESIKPIKPGVETNVLLYNRWTRTMEHLVDSLSGGKVGYVHVRAMDDPSFRTTFDKVLGKNIDKQALIVDTRYNGGGWLHDDLVTFLSGKLYFTLHPQGHTTKGGESLNKWTKPSCVVMSEGNYSDAFMFPYAYKELGIGKLIGMPVAGTGTAVWWEAQINNRIVFGIPMISSYGAGQEQPTENHLLEPDIRVPDEYNKILEGEDQQIEAAVREMLNTPPRTGL